MGFSQPEETADKLYDMFNSSHARPVNHPILSPHGQSLLFPYKDVHYCDKICVHKTAVLELHFAVVLIWPQGPPQEDLGARSMPDFCCNKVTSI